MPKERKAEHRGKPPLPSARHEVIDEWIAGGIMPAVAPLVVAVDKLIRSTIPDLLYAIKWTNAHYGLTELGWIIELAAFHKSINVVFFGGADFDPPPPLGETGRSRYVKLRSVDEVSSVELSAWVEQAGRIPGWLWTPDPT